MRKMNSEEMMQVNGGRYRYVCIVCGKKFRTSLVATIHGQFRHGWEYIRHINDLSRVLGC